MADTATCAQTASDTFCWGNNFYGQLGDGTTGNRGAPVAVKSLSASAQPTAGHRHACAIVGGQASYWGDNSFGQLGNGKFSVAFAPGLALRFDHIRPGQHVRRPPAVAPRASPRRAGRAEGAAPACVPDRGPGDRRARVLAPLAREVGLDEREVDDVLAGDRYAAEVRTDEAIARELGITGVPFFVLAGRLGVSGAQPADVLLGALRRAWADLARPDVVPVVEGAACGPGGCD
jgi:hypothetical protein